MAQSAKALTTLAVDFHDDCKPLRTEYEPRGTLKNKKMTVGGLSGAGGLGELL